MRKSMLFLILILCFASVYSAEKDRLAVMDVTDEDGIFDEKTLNNVTDYIFTKFQGTGLFWMIPKSDRDTALDKAIEETKLSSRKECVNEKCQLSLVAELQANFLINTKIKKLYETTCQISISKLDVEKRAGVFSWEEKFNCTGKGLYEAADNINFTKTVNSEVDQEKKDSRNNQKTYAQNNSSEMPVLLDGLLWSAKAREAMNWHEAKKYCESLLSDWRLPTISELRLLVKNCSATEKSGECGITDECLSREKCKSQFCDGCSGLSSGEYSKLGDTGWFWSSSEHSNIPDNAWYLNFGNGSVLGSNKKYSNYVRCVK